jgi:hypothetical protein
MQVFNARLQVGMQVVAVDMLHWPAVAQLHCRHLELGLLGDCDAFRSLLQPC